MKYLVVVLLFLATSILSHSQTYEIGGLIGGANYIGDVGKTNYINPNTLAVGGLFKWNRSPRHSFRASIMIAKIEGDDADSNENRRKERGYSFENSIKEFSLGIEYTFWEYKVHSGKPISAPYMYTGLTYFLYDATLIRPETGVHRSYEQAGTIAIPMVLGYKATVGTKMTLGFEIGARYTFTDDLDGSDPVKGPADNEDLKFGNLNNNDWYVFTGITMTFKFGRKPCYCNF